MQATINSLHKLDEEDSSKAQCGAVALYWKL